MMTDLRAMIEFASRFVERRFAECGRIAPMWHAVQSNGEHFVLASPADDKDTAAVLVRAYFELQDVVRCLFIDEAWTAAADTPEESERLKAWIDAGKSLEHYPGRIEVVEFMGEDINGLMMTAQRHIDRSGRKPRLGPLQIEDRMGWESMGRMVGMLPRRKATVQ